MSTTLDTSATGPVVPWRDIVIGNDPLERIDNFQARWMAMIEQEVGAHAPQRPHAVQFESIACEMLDADNLADCDRVRRVMGLPDMTEADAATGCIMYTVGNNCGSDDNLQPLSAYDMDELITHYICGNMPATARENMPVHLVLPTDTVPDLRFDFSCEWWEREDYPEWFLGPIHVNWRWALMLVNVPAQLAFVWASGNDLVPAIGDGTDEAIFRWFSKLVDRVSFSIYHVKWKLPNDGPIQIDEEMIDDYSGYVVALQMQHLLWKHVPNRSWNVGMRFQRPAPEVWRRAAIDWFGEDLIIDYVARTQLDNARARARAHARAVRRGSRATGLAVRRSRRAARRAE